MPTNNGDKITAADMDQLSLVITSPHKNYKLRIDAEEFGPRRESIMPEINVGADDARPGTPTPTSRELAEARRRSSAALSSLRSRSSHRRTT